MDVKHHVYLLTITTTELRGCVKVEVDILAPVPNKHTVSVDVKQHFNHHHNYFCFGKATGETIPSFFLLFFICLKKKKKKIHFFFLSPRVQLHAETEKRS